MRIKEKVSDYVTKFDLKKKLKSLNFYINFMKKNISTQLFDNLLKSDFLIVNKKGLQQKNKIVFSKTNTFFNLNPVYLLKNLKQFIRLIQFIEKNGMLTFCTKNRQLRSILNKTGVNFDYQIDDLISRNKNKPNAELLLLIDGIEGYTEKQLFSVLMKEKRFLVQTINLIQNSKNLNFYKIYNELNKLKKIIFLICLIQQIAKKN